MFTRASSSALATLPLLRISTPPFLHTTALPVWHRQTYSSRQATVPTGSSQGPTCERIVSPGSLVEVVTSSPANFTSGSKASQRTSRLSWLIPQCHPLGQQRPLPLALRPLPLGPQLAATFVDPPFPCLPLLLPPLAPYQSLCPDAKEATTVEASIPPLWTSDAHRCRPRTGNEDPIRLVRIMWPSSPLPRLYRPGDGRRRAVFLARNPTAEPPETSTAPELRV